MHTYCNTRYKQNMYIHAHMHTCRSLIEMSTSAYIFQFFEVIVSDGKDMEVDQGIHVLDATDAVVVESQILQLCQCFQTLNHFNVIEGQICNQK